MAFSTFHSFTCHHYLNVHTSIQHTLVVPVLLLTLFNPLSTPSLVFLCFPSFISFFTPLTCFSLSSRPIPSRLFLPTYLSHPSRLTRIIHPHSLPPSSPLLHISPCPTYTTYIHPSSPPSRSPPQKKPLDYPLTSLTGTLDTPQVFLLHALGKTWGRQGWGKEACGQAAKEIGCRPRIINNIWSIVCSSYFLLFGEAEWPD